MPRRYHRKQQKDDLITPTAFIVGILLLGAYYSLSNVQKGVFIASIVLLLIAIVALVFLITREKRKNELKKLHALDLIDLDNYEWY